MLKTCNKCKEVKKRTADNFHRLKSSKDGLRGRCRTCTAIAAAKYRSSPEGQAVRIRYDSSPEGKASGVKYARSPKGQAAADKATTKYINSLGGQATRAKYRISPEGKASNAKFRNSPGGKEARAEYARSPEGRVARARALSKYVGSLKGKESRRRTRQRRRSRAEEVEHNLTAGEWEDNLSYFKESCAYCGLTSEAHIENHGHALHQDHFIALSKQGGYTQGNIIPACMPCNTSKHNKDFIEWYPAQSFYSEEKESRILEYLNLQVTR